VHTVRETVSQHCLRDQITWSRCSKRVRTFCWLIVIKQLNTHNHVSKWPCLCKHSNVCLKWTLTVEKENTQVSWIREDCLKRMPDLSATIYLSADVFWFLIYRYWPNKKIWANILQPINRYFLQLRHFSWALFAMMVLNCLNYDWNYFF